MINIWTILLFLVFYAIAYTHGHVVGSRRMRRITTERLAAKEEVGT